MIGKENVESLNLQIPTNAENLILVENALNWIERNTSVEVNTNDLSNTPATVRLFILKYLDILKLPDGVSSESATGLSQSFNNTDKNTLLMQAASSIFGDEALIAGKVTFVSAQNPWC